MIVASDVGCDPESAVERLVARFGLVPHPEGGLYRELHRSLDQVIRAGDGERRSGITVIAYLLRQGERSRWHRLRGSDEQWHHGAGDPLDLWCLSPEGGVWPAGLAWDRWDQESAALPRRARPTRRRMLPCR